MNKRTLTKVIADAMVADLAVKAEVHHINEDHLAIELLHSIVSHLLDEEMSKQQIVDMVNEHSEVM